MDVLPGRDAEPLAAWLKNHREVEIICRDRAGAYAEGARSGAPQAVQVADAWHLWHNLGEAVEKTVSAHHACVRTAFENTVPAAPPTSDDIWQTPPPPASAAGMLDVCGRERRLVIRTRERYTAVQQLLDDGSTLEEICRTLRLDRSTVRRFARATSIDELLVKATNRSTILDEYRPYLHQRWIEGCQNSAQLYQEIVALGFAGSIQTVQRYLLPFKAATAAPRSRRPAPRPRRIVRRIMTDPGNLTADVAAVAARTLYQNGYVGADYVLTGPESLTQSEQVGVIGDALGHRIAFEEMTRDEFRSLSEGTAPSSVVDMLLAAWSAAVGQPAYVTTAVADILGTAPRTFRQWAAGHATAFTERS